MRYNAGWCAAAGYSSVCPPASAKLLSWSPLWLPGGPADRVASRSLERSTCANHPGQGKQGTKCLGGCLAGWALIPYTRLCFSLAGRHPLTK